MIKRLWGLALVLLLAVPAGAAEQALPDPVAPQATISAGGAVKFLYAFSQSDWETRYEGRDEFSTSLLDLRLSGRLTERVSWRMELAASWNPDYDMGNVGGMAGPNETGGAGVRQASIIIDRVVPYTTFELGTFIPPLTNYMPRRVEDLDLIQYPLINNAVFMETGYNPVTLDVSPWQQAGFNAAVRLPYMLELDVGMWNGMMPDRQAEPDPNLAKATSIVLGFRPLPELAFHFGHWGEDFEGSNPLAGRGALQLNIWYGYLSYITDTIEVTADFASASVPQDIILASGSKVDWRWEGFQTTVGYWFRPQLEVLVRYEQFDPNTLDTLDIPESRFDERRWLTLGANYRLNEQAELSVNYIYKYEDAKMIERHEEERDPRLSDWDAKYSAQHNNLVLVQFQVWQ